MLFKIWGFHGGDYEECRLLGYKNPVRTSQETHYVSATEPSPLMLCKIWGFHGGDYEEYRPSGMLPLVGLVRIDVSEERIAPIFRMERKSELGTLAVTSNWTALWTISSSLSPSTVKTEAMRYSQRFVTTYRTASRPRGIRTFPSTLKMKRAIFSETLETTYQLTSHFRRGKSWHSLSYYEDLGGGKCLRNISNDLLNYTAPHSSLQLCPEDGHKRSLRNGSKDLPDFTRPHARRQ
jgi:hypothetical protein